MLGLRTYAMLMALAVGPANAAIVTYSSTTVNPVANNSGTYVEMRDLWQGVTTGQATVDFNTVNSQFGTGYFTYDTSDNTSSRVTGFNIASIPAPNATSAQFFQVNGSNPYTQITSDLPMPAASKAIVSAGFGGALRVNVPTSPTGTVSSVAFDLYTWGPTASNVLVTVYSDSGSSLGEYYVSTQNSSTAAFFGLTSDTAIGFITLSSQGQVAINRFDFGTAGAAPDPPSETPESATLGYVGLGVLAILFGTKKGIHKA